MFVRVPGDPSSSQDPFLLAKKCLKPDDFYLGGIGVMYNQGATPPGAWPRQEECESFCAATGFKPPRVDQWVRAVSAEPAHLGAEFPAVEEWCWDEGQGRLVLLTLLSQEASGASRSPQAFRPAYYPLP